MALADLPLLHRGVTNDPSATRPTRASHGCCRQRPNHRPPSARPLSTSIRRQIRGSLSSPASTRRKSPAARHWAMARSFSASEPSRLRRLAVAAGVLLTLAACGSHTAQATSPKACSAAAAAAAAALADADKSVTVLIDFAGATPRLAVQETLESALTAAADRRYIADVVLVDNECSDAETRAYARALPASQDGVERKVVHIDARGAPVGVGRARAEALRHASGPVVVFLSAGVSVSQRGGSGGWLAPLLVEIARAGETVAVPVVRTESKRGKKEVQENEEEEAEGDAEAAASAAARRSAWTVTRRLNLEQLPLVQDAAAATASVKADFTTEPAEVAALSGLAFAARRDLLEAVGGYDAYFHRPDPAADSVGLSLSLWLCGARIVQVPCSVLVDRGAGAGRPVAADARRLVVADRSYAKYLAEVYLRRRFAAAASVEHAGGAGGSVDATTFNADVHVAAEARLRQLGGLGCLPFDWYARRFARYLPAEQQELPPYEPLDVPAKTTPDWNGRLFALFGGRCLHPRSDGLLGMSWCPAELPEDHRFRWTLQGRVEVAGKCLVTSSDRDWYFGVDRCNATDPAQQFEYDEDTRQVKHRLSGRCATHVTNPNDNSQGVMGTNCLPAANRDVKYQLFVLDGVWH